MQWHLCLESCVLVMSSSVWIPWIENIVLPAPHIWNLLPTPLCSLYLWGGQSLTTCSLSLRYTCKMEWLSTSTFTCAAFPEHLDQAPFIVSTIKNSVCQGHRQQIKCHPNTLNHKQGQKRSAHLVAPHALLRPSFCETPPITLYFPRGKPLSAFCDLVLNTLWNFRPTNNILYL